MKRDLSVEETESEEAILKELAGYTVEQAEAILSAVKTDLKSRAVIEGERLNG